VLAFLGPAAGPSIGFAVTQGCLAGPLFASVRIAYPRSRPSKY
jgi:hypothetical protein